MKLRVFYVTAIAFAVWGCEGLLDEQAGDAHTAGGNATMTTKTFNVMLDNGKAVNLVVHFGNGIPTKVDVDNITVELGNRGSGEWKIDAITTNSADITYDIYKNAASTAVTEVTLHWAAGSLEYLAVHGSHYQDSHDGKSGLGKGTIN